MNHKQRIAASFSAAAESYDTASPVQRLAAKELATQVLALSLPPVPRVLEIGCGTGHLTRELLPKLGGSWVLSDIAPPMLAACQTQHSGAAQYVVMDGEQPTFAPESFDLIVSSLAAQWFSNLPATLARLASLLAPGGTLALATLGAGTFREWQAAHSACGLTAATPNYPTSAELAASFPQGMSVSMQETWTTDPAEHSLAFVRGLRAIGATTPQPGVAPLSAGQLRKVMRALPSFAPRGVSYCLLYAIAEKPR